jgi:hypothetical protein
VFLLLLLLFLLFLLFLQLLYYGFCYFPAVLSTLLWSQKKFVFFGSYS